MKRLIARALVLGLMFGLLALGQFACGSHSSPTGPGMSGTPTPPPRGY